MHRELRVLITVLRIGNMIIGAFSFEDASVGIPNAV